MMKKNRSVGQGFTLIELLIVVSILGLLGLMVSATLTNVFRSQAKVNTIAQVKQNGQTAMDQIERLARFSDKVICGGSGIFTDRVVLSKQGTYIRLTYIAPSATANGYIAYDYPDQLSTVDPCTQPQLSPIVITNTDPTKGISISSAVFTKSSLPGFKDALSIQIFANTGVKAVGLSENILKNPIEFKTTIELR